MSRTHHHHHRQLKKDRIWTRRRFQMMLQHARYDTELPEWWNLRTWWKGPYVDTQITLVDNRRGRRRRAQQRMKGTDDFKRDWMEYYVGHQKNAGLRQRERPPSQLRKHLGSAFKFFDLPNGLHDDGIDYSVDIERYEANRKRLESDDIHDQ